MSDALHDEQIRPRLEYLIVCDAVGYGPDGRKTLYGIFDNLNFFNFPAKYPACSILCRYSGGTGEHKVRIRIADSDRNAIFETPAECPFKLPDPLTSVEIVLTLHRLQFPKPGNYWVQVLLDGVPDEHEHRLKVSRINVKPPATPEAPPASPDKPAL